MGRETMGAKQALRKETLVLQKKEYWYSTSIFLKNAI